MSENKESRREKAVAIVANLSKLIHGWSKNDFDMAQTAQQELLQLGVSIELPKPLANCLEKYSNPCSSNIGEQMFFGFAVEHCLTIVSRRNDVKIAKCQIRLLEYLVLADKHSGTIDDATEDLQVVFDDRGGWRGQVPIQLKNIGIIERVDACNSQRKSRKSSLIGHWRLSDIAKAKKKLKRLKAWVASVENPKTSVSKSDSNGGGSREV